MLSFGPLWTGLRHLVRNLLRRDRVERELTEEINGYVDLLPGSRHPDHGRLCRLGRLRSCWRARSGGDRQSEYEQLDLWRRTSRLDIARDLHVCARDGCGSRRTVPRLARDSG